jgi:pimeloyl-ACP methyl ester carboxylesterase
VSEFVSLPVGTVEPTTGRYVWIEIGGEPYRIHYEEAGAGVPLILLHTAGADGRQWRYVLNDPDITSRFRVIAYDMPWHGRSLPPGEQWWLERYRLTEELQVQSMRALWLALELEAPVVMGCSMGGMIAPVMAREFQDEMRGAIALEGALKLHGRYNDFLHHPAVHGGEMVATYTLGLNAPMSSEYGVRENWWYYAQGGPGVYAGDTLGGGSEDRTGQIKGTIDPAKCKVMVLTGEYDYSATPAMSQAMADEIEGCRFEIMQGIGHFPMTENYPLFKSYLMRALEWMLESEAPRG